MWRIQEIPRPTFAPSAAEPASFPEIISEPVSPVSFAPGPGQSSGKGETPTETLPGSRFPTQPRLAPPPPIIDWRQAAPTQPRYQPPLAQQPLNAPLRSDMNFGGIIKGVAKFVDNKFLGGAIQTIGGILDKPGVQQVLQAGPKYSTPGMPPLPSIGGGVVKSGGIFSDVRGGSSTTAPSGYRRHYRRMNPMNVKALRRAARRLESGEKLFRKVFSISHPGHGHSTVKIKRGRKRA